MTIHDPVSQARRRSALAWHEGGLTEIGVGLFLLLVASLMFVETRVQHGTPQHRTLVISQVIFNIGGILALMRGLPWLRNFLLASRAGYVRPRVCAEPKQKRKSWVASFAAFLLAAAAVFWNFLDRPDTNVLLTSFIGVLGGMLLLQIGAKLGLRRFLALGGLLPLLGAGIAWKAKTLDQAMIWTFGLDGLLLLFSGLMALALFLQTNKPVEVA